MAIAASGAPDITERIPTGFSDRVSFAGGISGQLVNFSASADVLFGDLPFRLAITPDRPYRRQSVPVSKDRYDASSEAGEQTLSGFWLRSQTSWHRGEGITYYEPSDEGTQHRYFHAVGVDVWDEGNLSLLRRVNRASSTPGFCAGAVNGTADVAVVVQGTAARRLNSDQSFTSLGTLPSAGTKPTVFGPTAWVGTSSGVSRVTIASSAISSAYDVAGSPFTVKWAKGRLIGTRDQSVYELAPNAAALTALPTALYTHPLATWQWTAAADAPGAFLVAGYAAGQSAIYRFALEDSNGAPLPTIGGATQVAAMPPGEYITAIESYLGTYLAIGTNRGVRIGVLGDAGALQYGPLVIETTQPVQDFAARDTFIYAGISNGIDGQSGVARINVSEEVVQGTGRFAWAYDAQCKFGGKVQSVALLGVSDRVVMTTDTTGTFLQSGSLYETSGYVTSGQVRYGTVENKSFQFARLQAAIPVGSVQLSTVTNSGAENTIFTYSAGNAFPGDIKLSQPTSPQESLGTKLTLRPSADQTGTPVVRGLSLKAVPVPGRRQRMIQVPLWCMEHEKDKQGNTVHGVGYVRLAALEALEASGGVVQMTDRRTGESLSVTIEEIDYVGNLSPAGEEPRFDGVVTVTVKTV